MVNKKISQDEKVAKLSIEATLLYTWCIAYLDFQGRIYGDIWTLKAIVPYIKELTPKKITLCIQAWVRNDLVIYYGNGQKYLEFKGFSKNQTLQKDREADSVIPAPTELQRNSSETPVAVKLSKVNISKDTSMSICGLTYEKVLELWNLKMPWKIKEISNTRKTHLRERFKEKVFCENFPLILDLILKSDFLLGKKPSKTHSNFKAGLDWVIANDTNYLKILEGKYDNTKADFFDQYRKDR